MTKDEAQEHVLTQLRNYCTQMGDGLRNASTKEIADKTELSLVVVEELQRQMVAAWDAERQRVHDQIMFLRNGKR